jgi:hypothetical protein
VAEDGPALVGVGGDDGDLGAVGERAVEVGGGAVDAGGYRRLGQPRPDGGREVGGSGADGEATGRPVGKADLDLCRCG